MDAIWKDIDFTCGKYQVSNTGQVRRVRRKNTFILKYMLTKNGYARVCIRTAELKKFYLVHRLVSQAFIPNEFGKKQVNHIDGNKLNNHVQNLEWCTREENICHAKRLGLFAYGDKNPTRRPDELLI